MPFYPADMAVVIALLLIGALLLMLEFILPGGIAGMVGLGCLIAGVVMGYKAFGNPIGHMILVGVVLGLIAGFIFWLTYFPRSKAGQIFVSHGQVGNLGIDRTELVGQLGTAYTPLRPSGTAVINGKRVDVVSEGTFVERGQEIKVVAVEGNRVVVRAIL